MTLFPPGTVQMILRSASRAVGSLSLIIAISVITSSCQPKAAVEGSTAPKGETKTPPSEVAAPQDTPRDDGWQRMKDCAAQTDRIAKQQGWVERESNGEILTRWQNHYSPKYARCYIQVHYVNNAPGEHPNIPITSYDFIDAFEQKLLSTCSDSFTTSALCMVTGDHRSDFDCHACRQFVKDRMEN
jgi:hypothetical protein